VNAKKAKIEAVQVAGDPEGLWVQFLLVYLYDVNAKNLRKEIDVEHKRQRQRIEIDQERTED
jgi:hypothetical protein